MIKNNGIRLICFLLIFFLLFYLVNLAFTPGSIARNEKASFYEEPENSIEVIFCGSSSILRDISPMEMYRDYGIAGYSLATVLQAPAVTAFTVKEALRYQTPKVIVLNMESAAIEYDYSAREAHIHSSLDPFRFSVDKLDAIISIHNSDPNQSISDYLFPVMRYHDAWQDFGSFERMEQEVSFRKGYDGLLPSTPAVLGPNYMAESGECVELLDDAMVHYREAIATAQEAGIPVLLIKLPRMTWTLEEHEALERFAQEVGIDFLDFNTEEMWQVTQLELETDFYDPNHLCHSGAVKLSGVLGQYLKEHYELTDIRNLLEYQVWNELLELYEAEYAS